MLNTLRPRVGQVELGREQSKWTCPVDRSSVVWESAAVAAAAPALARGAQSDLSWRNSPDLWAARADDVIWASGNIYGSGGGWGSPKISVMLPSMKPLHHHRFDLGKIPASSG
jgi:hypothetical protein